MPVLMILVALLFAAALAVHALPQVIYIAPVLAVGLLISWINDAIHHKSKPAGH